MDLLELLILGLAGLFGGVLAGLFGVGGGTVFVPALVYAAGWNIREAVAASLVIIVFSALSGTLRSMRSEVPVNWKAAGLFSATVAPSALIGVAISQYFSETITQLVFAGFLLALAYPTARSGKRYRENVGGSTHPALPLIFGSGLNSKTAISTSLVVTLAISIVGAAGYVPTGFDRFAGLPPLIVGSIVGAWPGVRVRESLGE